MISKETKVDFGGVIADFGAQLLKEAKIKHSAIFVFDPSSSTSPVATRTPDQGGWGVSSHDYAITMTDLTKAAETQARLAINTNRSADEVLVTMAEEEISAASYGPFPVDLLPFYANSQKTRHIVVAVAEGQRQQRLHKIAEEAVAQAEAGNIPVQTEAANWLWLCMHEMEAACENGFALVALPEIFRSLGAENFYGLPVVASQACGEPFRPNWYERVKATAVTTAMTGKASGPQSPYDLSRKIGAVPAQVDKRGNRVLALGGIISSRTNLRSMDNASRLLRADREVTILDQFPHKRNLR